MGGRCSGLRTWLITRVWVAKAQKVWFSGYNAAEQRGKLEDEADKSCG